MGGWPVGLRGHLVPVWGPGLTRELHLRLTPRMLRLQNIACPPESMLLGEQLQVRGKD